MQDLSFTEITWVGVPACLVGILFLALTSKWLLPIRKPPIGDLQDSREYTVDMTVIPGGPLIGRSIEEAGLRHLPGVFLAEIQARRYRAGCRFAAGTIARTTGLCLSESSGPWSTCARFAALHRRPIKRQKSTHRRSIVV